MLFLLLVSVLWSLSDAFSYCPVRATFEIARSSQRIPSSILRSVKKDMDVIEAMSSALTYLQSESLSGILSAVELKQIIAEIKASPSMMKDLQGQFYKTYERISRLAAEENQSLEEVLGVDVTQRLINAAEGIDIYEPSAVRTFLQQPVFESMLGGILYEGIFEFLKKVDILGNIVNGLPIIGPIRQTIMKEFKNSLDKTLGAQIKTFLSSFNKIAVSRMVEFVLSPQNRIALTKANRKIAEYLLSRKLNKLLPVSGENNIKLRDLIWKTISEAPQSDLNKIVDSIYGKVGEKTFGSLLALDYTDIITAAPTVNVVVSRNFKKFFDTKNGASFRDSISLDS